MKIPIKSEGYRARQKSKYSYVLKKNIKLFDMELEKRDEPFGATVCRRLETVERINWILIADSVHHPLASFISKTDGYGRNQL